MTEETGDMKYKVIGESEDGKIRQLYWNLSIGLNEVDGLKPSRYFKDLVKENVEGKYTYQEVGDLVRKHYNSLEKKYIDDSEKECDLVASRIYGMMINNNFSLQVNSLSRIHYELFKDVLDTAGQYKNQYLAKDEPTLNGLSVVYGDYHDIQDDLEDIINDMKKMDFRKLDKNDKVQKIAYFTSKLWQVHPFSEGNTRTISVFIGKYLRKLGYDITNDLFYKHSLYFRNALVRDNFNVPNQNFFGDDDCLIKFFGNLMYNENNVLDIRDTVVKEAFVLADGSGYDIDYEKIFNQQY